MSPAPVLEEKARDFVGTEIAASDNPPAAAAKAVDDLIQAAVRKTAGIPGAIPPNEIVRQCCKGGMSALLLAGHDLPLGVAALLNSLTDLSQELSIDPGELLTWALEGIARLAPALSPAQVQAIRDSIDSTYMGAGDIFIGLCRNS